MARQGGSSSTRWSRRWPAAGIVLSEWHSLEEDDRAYLVDVLPAPDLPGAHAPGHGPGPSVPVHLQPVAQPHGPGRPTRSPGASRIARVKVPPLLPRFVVLPDGERFVPLEQVIAAHLDTLFPAMSIGEHYAFRVDPQRRPGGGGGRGRRPAGRGRDGAAAPPVRRGRPARGGVGHAPTSSGRSWSRRWGSTLGASTGSTSRSTSAGCGPSSDLDRPTWPPSPGCLWRRPGLEPTGTARGTPRPAGPARRHRPEGDPAPPPLRLLRSHRSRRSSPRPPPTPTSWRSSRPSTAPRARAPSSSSLIRASRGGQAGGRGGRAPGALRRAGQHRLGPCPRGGRRGGRLRATGPEDPRQDRPGGPP